MPIGVTFAVFEQNIFPISDGFKVTKLSDSNISTIRMVGTVGKGLPFAADADKKYRKSLPVGSGYKLCADG